MTVSMTDEQLEREIRGALARQAEDLEGAPTATEIVVRIRAAGLRGARLRHPSWWPSALPADRRLVAATVALLLLALVGSLALVGDLLDREAPVVVKPTQSSSRPSSSPRVEPTYVDEPPTVDSGLAETAIGRLSWTKLQGTRDTLPLGELFETPDGFGAIDHGLKSGSRFWESPDGIEWTVRPLPVPAVGAVEHGFSNGEHWLWSEAEFRLWRSSDFASWAEVDLRDLAPAPVAGLEWSMTSMGPTTLARRPCFRGAFAEVSSSPSCSESPLSPAIGSASRTTGRNSARSVPSF